MSTVLINMKYTTLIELYLTFLNHNDSYMEKVPVGTVLALKQGYLYFNGKQSIDNHVGFLHHNYITEWNANPTGDGSGLEHRRAHNMAFRVRLSSIPPST